MPEVLAQVKPSCSSRVPEAKPFNGDFATTMDNLCQLLGEATTPGFTEKCGVTTGPDNALCIKVQHPFEVSPPYYCSKILLTHCYSLNPGRIVVMAVKRRVTNLEIGMGNPWVFSQYLHPYPHIPLPFNKGMGYLSIWVRVFRGMMGTVTHVGTM